MGSGYFYFIYFIAVITICIIIFFLMRSENFYKTKSKQQDIKLMQLHMEQKFVNNLLLHLETVDIDPMYTMGNLAYQIINYLDLEGIIIHNMDETSICYEISQNQEIVINQYVGSNLQTIIQSIEKKGMVVEVINHQDCRATLYMTLLRNDKDMKILSFIGKPEAKLNILDLNLLDHSIKSLIKCALALQKKK